MQPHHEVKPVYISRQQVPKYFPGINPKTLANENCQGKGPTPVKKGRLIFYRFRDLEELFGGVGK